jgi:cytochrome c oxidase assembly protein subunit 11
LNLKVKHISPFIFRFNADTSSALLWHFKPHQLEIKIVPGETALAFYSARNPTDKPVVGIATYNVIPFDAGVYFNKIQCFCFEEQRLNPHEQVGVFPLPCMYLWSRPRHPS